MASTIAAEIREKMEKLEATVMAIDHLSGLATVVDDNCAMDFANLTHYLSTHLSDEFNVIHRELKERVLPFVEATKAVNLG